MLCFAQDLPSSTNLSNSSSWSSGRSSSSLSTGTSDTVRLRLSAVFRDVTNFSAAVASLAALGVEWAAVGSSAVARDVPKFSAGVALHALGLAITGVMVGAAALVAGRSAGHATTVAASEAAPTAAETTSCWWGSTASRGAVAGEMTWLAAGVAATAGGTAQTQSWAVSLDMAKTLAVVALLRLSGAWVWAAVGLVTGLLAVVAETLRGRAHLGVVADVATLVAGATR